MKLVFYDDYRYHCRYLPDNEKSVYMTGWSNGCMMTQLFAVEHKMSWPLQDACQDIYD